MGTRSAIGYKLPSGRIKAVYCHYDGYPKHHLPILIEHYNTLNKARALIKPGSMSSLRTRETWDCGPLLKYNETYVKDSEGLLMYQNDREPQPLYYYDRGNTSSDPPEVRESITVAKKYWAASGCEHMYIFEPDVGWIHYDLNKPEPKPKFTKTQELLSSLL